MRCPPCNTPPRLEDHASRVLQGTSTPQEAATLLQQGPEATCWKCGPHTLNIPMTPLLILKWGALHQALRTKFTTHHEKKTALPRAILRAAPIAPATD